MTLTAYKNLSDFYKMEPSEDTPQIMGNIMELSMGQKFEMERMNRAIDACQDMAELKSLAKRLVSAWMTQKAATAWMIREQLKTMGKSPNV